MVLAWTLLIRPQHQHRDARRRPVDCRLAGAELDLIDVNDPTGQFKPPKRAELNHFRDALRRRASACPSSAAIAAAQDVTAAAACCRQPAFDKGPVTLRHDSHPPAPCRARVSKGEVLAFICGEGIDGKQIGKIDLQGSTAVVDARRLGSQADQGTGRRHAQRRRVACLEPRRPPPNRLRRKIIFNASPGCSSSKDRRRPSMRLRWKL